MDPMILAAILGTGGFSAISAAVITGLFSRRKLGADATEIITKAAAGVVISMQAQLAFSEKSRQDDQASCARKMDHMARAHIQERNEWRKVLQLHVAWDALAIAKLAETGVEMPPTPPLTPAHRYVGDDGYPLTDVD